jgi:hypothetical protein
MKPRDGMQDGDVLRMWTLYDSPTDFPGMFVLREWAVTGNPDGPNRCAKRWSGGGCFACRATLKTNRILWRRGFENNPSRPDALREVATYANGRLFARSIRDD